MTAVTEFGHMAETRAKTTQNSNNCTKHCETENSDYNIIDNVKDIISLKIFNKLILKN